MGNGNLGICVGSFSGENVLVGEDSVFFSRPLGYSIVAKKGTTLMRYPASTAIQSYPLDTQKALRRRSITKYKWLYERVNRLETQLLAPPANIQKISTAQELQLRTNLNFPLACSPAKIAMKKTKLKKLDNKEEKFLATAPRPLKNKRLDGYLDGTLDKRLEKTYKQVFTGEKDNTWIKSERLAELKQRENHSSRLRTMRDALAGTMKSRFNQRHGNRVANLQPVSPSSGAAT